MTTGEAQAVLCETADTASSIAAIASLLAMALQERAETVVASEAVEGLGKLALGMVAPLLNAAQVLR